jgi:hypothetical protein
MPTVEKANSDLAYYHAVPANRQIRSVLDVDQLRGITLLAVPRISHNRSFQASLPPRALFLSNYLGIRRESMYAESLADQ